MDISAVTTTAATVTTWVSVLPIDWAIIAALIVVVGILSLRPGATYAMTALYALPLAVVLNLTFPKSFFLGAAVHSVTFAYTDALVFAACFVIAYLFIGRISSSYSTMGGPVEAVLSAISVAVLALVVWQIVPALSDIWHFGPFITSAFAEIYRFWWIIFSLLVLAFARN